MTGGAVGSGWSLRPYAASIRAARGDIHDFSLLPGSVDKSASGEQRRHQMTFGGRGLPRVPGSGVRSAPLVSPLGAGPLALRTGGTTSDPLCR
jgi:hypothetical protein